MINAQDLRIGNYVNYINKIIRIDYDIMCETFTCNDWQDFNPIPLSEEILLKCDIKDEFYLEYDEILECYCIYLTDNFCLNSVRLLHLHTLQNLYWCLVGRELNVNL